MGGFFFNSVRLHMANDGLEHFDDGKVTVGERVWYFINGLAAVSPQIYLYHSIFGIVFFDTYYLYVVVSLVAAYLMSEAYHNAAYWLRDRLGHARADIVTNNLVATVNAGKKNATQIKDIKEGQRKQTHSESSAFAIVYNNFFFFDRGFCLSPIPQALSLVFLSFQQIPWLIM